MRLQIGGTFAAALFMASLPALAQSPPAAPVPQRAVHSNIDKAQDHAQHKQQWKDCMAGMESKEKTMKAGDHHVGNVKTATTEKATGKAQPVYEPKNQGKGETPESKMNRHEEMMQDCRNQLYGGRHEEPAPGGKVNGPGTPR